MSAIARLRSGLKIVKPREFALTTARCPFCGPSVFVRLRRVSLGVRCLRCAASAIHLAVGWTLADHVPDLAQCDVCELSARGPLAAYLRRTARSTATSEYFADSMPGSWHGDIRCEDAQRLSYADDSFDVVTHTEVLEHVPDDMRALAELLRVLRPGGAMIFTVPMHDGSETIERARLIDGDIGHLLEPVYHFDPLTRAGILAFRDYGTDILDRLRTTGFVGARVVRAGERMPWLYDGAVVVARKARRDAQVADAVGIASSVGGPVRGDAEH